MTTTTLAHKVLAALGHPGHIESFAREVVSLWTESTIHIDDAVKAVRTERLKEAAAA